MNANLMHAMTGLKKGGTHRGKRSRGFGPKKPAGTETTAEEHKEALDTHMASGKDGKAKIAALALAKALHKRQKETSSTLTPDAKALI